MNHIRTTSSDFPVVTDGDDATVVDSFGVEGVALQEDVGNVVPGMVHASRLSVHQ